MDEMYINSRCWVYVFTTLIYDLYCGTKRGFSREYRSWTNQKRILFRPMPDVLITGTSHPQCCRQAGRYNNNSLCRIPWMTFVSSTSNHKSGLLCTLCTVLPCNFLSCPGRYGKSHGHFRNFTVTLFYILLLAMAPPLTLLLPRGGVVSNNR